MVNSDQVNHDNDSQNNESEDNSEQLEETKERQKCVKLPKYGTDNYVMNNKHVDDNDDSIYIYMNIVLLL